MSKGKFIQITLGSTDSSYEATVNTDSPTRHLQHLAQSKDSYSHDDIISLSQIFQKAGLNFAHQIQDQNTLAQLIEQAKSDATVLTQKDHHGNTLLHKACLQGRADLSQPLIAAHPELISQINDRGQTPLHLAIAKNQEAIVKQITSIDLPLPFDLVDYDGNSVLHLTSASGNSNIASMIFTNIDKKKPQEITKKNLRGLDPLELACIYGNLTAIEKLLETGCFRINELKPTYGLLHLAILSGQALAADLLLEKGANVDLIDGNGSTALHLACQQGKLQCVRVLLNNGADLHKRDRANFTALQKACARTDLEIIETLLNKAKKDRGTEILADPIDLKRNKTPLHIAIENKRINVFDALIGWYDFETSNLTDENTNVSTTEVLKEWSQDNRKSPLELAHKMKQDHMVKSLLANQNYKGLFKVTARKDKFGSIKSIIDDNKDGQFFEYNNFDDFIKAELQQLLKSIENIGESHLTTNLNNLHQQLSEEFESESISRKVKVAKLVFETQAFIDNFFLNITPEKIKPYIAQFQKNSKRACLSQTIWDLIKTIAVIALAALFCATIATYASFAMAYPMIITTPITTVLSHVPLTTTLFGAGVGAAGGLLISLLSFFHVNWSINNISRHANNSINHAINQANPSR